MNTSKLILIPLKTTQTLVESFIRIKFCAPTLLFEELANSEVIRATDRKEQSAFRCALRAHIVEGNVIQATPRASLCFSSV